MSERNDLLEKALQQRQREREAEERLKEAEPQMVRDWADSVGKKPDC